MPNPATIEFYFDPVCPWAYLASRRIEDLSRRTGAALEWHPTLLGGIYDAIKAPQGKHNSASVLNSAQKGKYESRELWRTAKRWGVDLRFHPGHPIRSVKAGRFLHSLASHAQRATLAHALFKAYWIDNLDIANSNVLLGIINGAFPWRQLDLDGLHAIVEHSETYKGALRATTDLIVSRGAVGVPDCFIPDARFPMGGRMFWGGDRFCFVEGAVEEAKVPGLEVPRPFSAVQETVIPRGLLKEKNHLTFWFDFSSPWTYLGATQLSRILAEAGPNLTISLKPTLLGIVFKRIGTPVVPSAVTSPAKRALSGVDLQNWVRYWSHLPYPDGTKKEIPFKFNEHFPVRTPQALRIALAAVKEAGTEEAKPGDKVWELVDRLFKAVWADNVNVSDTPSLIAYLNAHGHDGDKLLAAANTGDCETQLRKNVDDFVSIGGCGFPTFQIGSEIVWGQDRLDVVHDLLRGWNPETDDRATVVLRGGAEKPKI